MNDCNDGVSMYRIGCDEEKGRKCREYNDGDTQEGIGLG